MGSTSPVTLPPRDTPADIVRAGAGRCVACGLCLPHCPTYRKTKSELESPRGRLSLMLAVAKGELEPTAKLETHLSLCLSCRSCETVCPALVPFGDVMDAARVQLRAHRPRSLRYRLLLRAIATLAHPAWLAFVGWSLWLYRHGGLQALLRRSGILQRLALADADAQLPPAPVHSRFAAVYPARGDKRGSVALFLGCVARLTDARTLHDSIRVLTGLGYEVRIPSRQVCCGALHRHDGDARTADALMHKNIVAFAGENVDAVVTVASGCGAMLIEYRGDTAAAAFAGKVVDISSFLRRIEWPVPATLRPLPRRVAVHDPCTLTNVLRAPGAPYDLLRRIPQIGVVPLPDNKACCGAAGVYHLEHKQMAASLRDDKIEHVRRLAPDILVSSNVGCAMHLAAGIRAAGLAIEVVHPITLIARQLQA